MAYTSVLGIVQQPKIEVHCSILRSSQGTLQNARDHVSKGEHVPRRPSVHQSRKDKVKHVVVLIQS